MRPMEPEVRQTHDSGCPAPPPLDRIVPTPTYCDSLVIQPWAYRRVILESPFSADDPHQHQIHLNYARACLRDCLMHRESPIASHLLLTQPGVLDDRDLDERALGIGAGWSWYDGAHACVVYLDRGYSVGMSCGVMRAYRRGVPIEWRTLGPEWRTLAAPTGETR